jgi:hypothetical protein
MATDLVSDYPDEEQGEAPSRCLPYSRSEDEVEDLTCAQTKSGQSGLIQTAEDRGFGVTYRANPADGHEIISGKAFHVE